MPLFARGAYRDHVFNFRDDPESAQCNCADAAGWPEPIHGRGLGDGDELGAFIAAVHRERDALLNKEGA